MFLHSQSQKLLENVEDVGVQVLCEEECFQSGAVLLHLFVMLQKENEDHLDKLYKKTVEVDSFLP
jgi:hypothetical protein